MAYLHGPHPCKFMASPARQRQPSTRWREAGVIARGHPANSLWRKGRKVCVRLLKTCCINWFSGRLTSALLHVVAEVVEPAHVSRHAFWIPGQHPFHVPRIVLDHIGERLARVLSEGHCFHRASGL